MVRSTLSPAAAARPRRRWLRNTLITLGVLVALLGLATATAYWFVSDAINQVQRVDFVDESLERPAATTVNTEEAAPVNILLLGTDAREAMEGDPDSLTGFRSDAIMVAQLSPDREHLTVMSIMRDNWVPIAGFGEAKINAAFSYGGLLLAVNTVEQFIGARIDHVAIVDFASFEGLTEAVGGVTVHNSVSFTSHHGGTEFPQGEVSLSGDEALDFVRERYAFSDGDYQRVRNQQAFMSGLVTNLLSGDTLGDPVRIMAAFQALQPHLLLDRDLDLHRIIELGLSAHELRSGDVHFFTSPTLGTGTSADGQSIVLPDWDAIADVRAAFRNGTLDGLQAELANE